MSEQPQDDNIIFDFDLEEVDKHLNIAYEAFEQLEDDDVDPKEVKEILNSLRDAESALKEVIAYVKDKHDELEQDAGFKL